MPENVKRFNAKDAQNRASPCQGPPPIKHKLSSNHILCKTQHHLIWITLVLNSQDVPAIPSIVFIFLKLGAIFSVLKVLIYIFFLILFNPFIMHHFASSKRVQRTCQGFTSRCFDMRAISCAPHHRADGEQDVISLINFTCSVCGSR